MQKKPLITFVIGTRPEAIKLAPLIILFKSCESISTRVVFTGQHKEMVSQVSKIFNIKEDLNLGLMKHGQSLTFITNTILEGLDMEFDNFKPQLVLVQGDTTTAFTAALSAFYKKIPVAHVEAGLRTKSLNNPFPEEANRRLISQITNLHFAPTKEAYINLIKSGISSDNIEITGNTVVDALNIISKKDLKNKADQIYSGKDLILLVTVHRRENWGKNLNSIVLSIKRIIEFHKEVSIIIPMHKNKIVRDTLREKLGNNSKVILTETLPYDQLIGLMQKSYFIITDSGGIQEEAPSLGKPVLILRETTERVEGIKAKTAKLVGTNPDNIFKEVSELINNKSQYIMMSKAMNPYGDGNSSKRILKRCLSFLFVKARKT